MASRVLHTLALRDQTGPEFITRRLRQCRAGVPMRAVLVSAAVMLVAYLGPTGAPGAVGGAHRRDGSEIDRVVVQLHRLVFDCLCYHLRDLPVLLPDVCIHLALGECGGSSNVRIPDWMKRRSTATIPRRRPGFMTETILDTRTNPMRNG